MLGRVEALLASHEGQSQFLNTPVVEQIADAAERGVRWHDRGRKRLHAGRRTRRENGTFQWIDPHARHIRTTQTMRFPWAIWSLRPNPARSGGWPITRVLEVIGRGAFGTVLRAFDEKLQRVVAIKVMAPKLASDVARPQTVSA